MSEATYSRPAPTRNSVEQPLVLKGIGPTSVYVAVLDCEAIGPAET